MPQIGRLAGIASFFIDGTAYQAASDLEYQPTAFKREPLIGLDGTLQGYTETGEPPFISVMLRDSGSLTVGDLYDMTNVQVLAQLANGKSVSGYSMTVMEAISVKNADATFSVKFIGPEVTEEVTA